MIWSCLTDLSCVDHWFKVFWYIFGGTLLAITALALAAVFILIVKEAFTENPQAQREDRDELSVD